MTDIERNSGDFSIGGYVWPGTSKLIEEMGELNQVLGKLIGSHGDVNHWDGSNLRDRLLSELGDVMAAIQHFIEEGDLDRGVILTRCQTKLDVFRGWHDSERKKNGQQ